jgi:diadenosine tetraphosphate (Ap4A) HIT family hydrolase
MTDTQGWMPRERWEALVAGQNCPACAEVASDEPSNVEGYWVADLDMSRLRLAANQYVKGYCVLLCRRHVREPYQLSREEYGLFFEDMMRVGEALERVFSSMKMNFQILGNAVPHLHVHVLPRYYGDPAPHRPLDPGAEQVFLSPDEYAQRLELIRSALS